MGIQLAAVSNYPLIDKANNARFAMDTAANVSKSVQILFERALRFEKILAGDNFFPAGGWTLR